MFVRAEHFRVGLLECAKQTAFSGRLIVVADTIVVGVSGSGIFQKRIGALQNPQVSVSDGLFAGLHHKEGDTARQTAEELLRRKQFVSDGERRQVLGKIEASVRARYDADRAYIVLNSLAAAAIGEIVSGFGFLALQLF